MFRDLFQYSKDLHEGPIWKRKSFMWLLTYVCTVPNFKSLALAVFEIFCLMAHGPMTETSKLVFAQRVYHQKFGRIGIFTFLIYLIGKVKTCWKNRLLSYATDKVIKLIVILRASTLNRNVESIFYTYIMTYLIGNTYLIDSTTEAFVRIM